jgi:hypothetical protein
VSPLIVTPGGSDKSSQAADIAQTHEWDQRFGTNP